MELGLADGQRLPPFFMEVPSVSSEKQYPKQSFRNKMSLIRLSSGLI